jgi:hypothetical protein
VRLAARIERLIDASKDRVIILDVGTVQDRESWIPPMEVLGSQRMPTQRNAIVV